MNRWAGEGADAPRVIVARVERFGASTLNEGRAGERGLVDLPGGLPTYDPVGRRGRRRSQGDRGACREIWSNRHSDAMVTRGTEWARVKVFQGWWHVMQVGWGGLGAPPPSPAVSSGVEWVGRCVAIA